MKRAKKHDPHVGCFAWPNCDLNPLGCFIEYGYDAEEYGHRDSTNKNNQKELLPKIKEKKHD